MRRGQRIRQNNRKKLRVRNLLFGLGLITISTYLLSNMFEEANATIGIKEALVPSRSMGVQAKTFKQETTLGAIGDILIHDWVYNDAKRQNGYDFHPMFDHVREVLSAPNLLLANQETVLGGEALGISSYPMFNSPVEVGDAVKAAGVDIVSTANNHSLDRREQGLLTSLNQLNSIGLPSVGTYSSLEDQQTLTILHSNGISVAYLSYTYGTNGMPIPEGKNYLVNLINREQMSAEITRARESADVVVMSIHWGNEYQRFPTKDQEELAQFLVDKGVDVLFGHHPHVLQPMQWLNTADGRQALVVYSLGNFLSGQMRDYKDIGGMATVQVHKTINQAGTSIQLTHPEFYPTYVSSHNLKQYRVVPLQEAHLFGLSDAASKYQEIMNHMTGSLR